MIPRGDCLTGIVPIRSLLIPGKATSACARILAPWNGASNPSICRNLVEVTVESGVPSLVRTIPIEKGVLFNDMFDDQALVLKDKKIKLGNRTLVELDLASPTSAV